MCADKYHDLYSSVGYNEANMSDIRAEIETCITSCGHNSDFIISVLLKATRKLKSNKEDGRTCLSTNRFTFLLCSSLFTLPVYFLAF